MGVFAAIGVQVEAAVVEQADEARPDAVGEAVSDGGGLRRDFGQAAGGGLEERLPLFEGGLQLELPHAEALIGMLEQDAFSMANSLPIRARASLRKRDSVR